MSGSIKFVFAAALTAAGLGIVGCSYYIPQKDAPGGILSGSELARNPAGQRNMIDANGNDVLKASPPAGAEPKASTTRPAAVPPNAAPPPPPADG
jgi:hypothetical protein